MNWTLYDVKGHLPDLKFSLPGAGGKTVSSDDLKGKTVLLFFGYASCPDICPTTMAQLTAVLQNLGDKARDVRIVFVSVDPHRDTPDILQAYVDAFNKNAIGVTGDESRSPTWRAATASPTRSKAQARRRRRDLRCDAQPRRVHFRQQPRAAAGLGNRQHRGAHPRHPPAHRHDVIDPSASIAMQHVAGAPRIRVVTPHERGA